MISKLLVSGILFLRVIGGHAIPGIAHRRLRLIPIQLARAAVVVPIALQGRFGLLERLVVMARVRFPPILVSRPVILIFAARTHIVALGIFVLPETVLYRRIDLFGDGL